MSYELILTEKPSQAKKIAESLTDSKVLKKAENGVPYYILSHNKQDIVVVSAVGHVYSLREKEKSYKYPSFDIEWAESSLVNKSAAFSKKYLKLIKKLAKDATTFTVATDFDIEGEVIGLNLVRFACKQKDAQRMKFSTLTKSDLIESYKNKKKTIDWGQANAGETRHFLDWMYGINISRALSLAIRKAGLYKSLSSGRVQGPALKLIVDKEKEIRAFIPTPYWQISFEGTVPENGKQATIEAMHKINKFLDEEKANKVHDKISGKDGTVKSIERRETKSQAPAPFDLTTLQTESYRSLRIAPKDTLAIAQELYSKGYTSYPRTSSQQLPEELGLKKLLTELTRHNLYKDLAKKILSQKTIKPHNGKKKDPAHPAIYPTGILPSEGELEGREFKVYDLIVRRFLATFADDAIRETNKLNIDVVGEEFIAKGTRTIYQGWQEFYGPHVKLEEETLPKVEKGQTIKHKQSKLHHKMTKPPKRFTPASLIKELEKRELGTKATRAQIIETLFDRGYVAHKTLEPTEMGIKTSDILEANVPEIVQEELTRRFEEEMEKIREGEFDKEKVLKEAQKALTKILEEFKTNEDKIGKALKESLFESQEKENTIGPCPNCKNGLLMIKYSPKTKQKFIGCSAYPDCKTIFNLPGNGSTAKSSDKVCEACGYPMIRIGIGRSERIACFNPECPVKKKQEEEQQGPELAKALNSPCPKCGEKSLVLRRSMYGQFIGCSNYPKCKCLIQIPKDGGPIDMTPVEPKKKTKKKAATKKKSTKKKTTKKTSIKKASKKTTANKTVSK